MANEKQRKTFISYSRVNKDFAVRLAKELKSEGFAVWLDQLDIPAGARWDVELEKALEECEIFMIIMTPSSISSENVRDEIGYAIDNGKRFLPVLLENCNVPLRLRRFQYVDFTNKNFDDGVESAKDLLRNLIAQTTVPRTVLPQEAREQMAQVEAERSANEEADRLAKHKAEAEKAANSEADRKAQEEADRLAKQKAEAERAAKAEADRKAQEEADRLAKQKAEAERAAKVDADRKAKEEVDRLAKQKAETEKAAKAEADRKAREEADRLVRQKAEVEKAAKVEADRKSKEEADRLAKQRVVSAESKPVAPAPQKKPMPKGLIFGIIGVAAIAVCGIGYGIVSNLSVPAATEEVVFQPTAAQAPVVVEKPTEVKVSQPTAKPAAQPTATKPAAAAPAPTQTAKPEFFTLRFDQNSPLDDFEFFEIGSGNENKLTITPTNDGLEFVLNDEDLYAYYIYTPYTYGDVSVRMRAENVGSINRNNVGLVCRRTGDDWYEYGVTNGGLWDLYTHSESNGYVSIDSGGTTALKTGRAVNEYEMRCVGNEISLYINGQPVKTTRTNAFTSGEVGINVSSLDLYPIEILVSEFEISSP